MDPVANIEQQRDHVTQIHQALREPLGTVEGFADEASRDAVLAAHAIELAELAQALDEWRLKGGFDPYTANGTPDQAHRIAGDLLALIDSGQRVSPSVIEGNARRLCELVLV